MQFFEAVRSHLAVQPGTACKRRVGGLLLPALRRYFCEATMKRLRREAIEAG